MALKGVNFRLAKPPIVPTDWVGPIIILFMLLTSGIVFYALTLWRPRQSKAFPFGAGDATLSGPVALERVLEQIGFFLEQHSATLASQESQAKNLSEQKSYVEAAKMAVQRAVNHTRHYIAGRRAGDRDRRIERELSDEWLEVGERLRKINGFEAQELHMICFLKARFWSDTDGWNDSYAGGRDISIESVLKYVGSITTKN
ncbi:hypothetical protein [uncultured Desulfobacter sp.]|uniref:hypothetical protein n=1 Tax=uncultured Desulfobacter sp. TaxID=240139 RepID=UPI0029F54DC7|nr:hypothetical protein [uncultured Desulfobacter sp.]